MAERDGLRGRRKSADARRSQPPIKVWVTPNERAALTARAESAGLSLSAYMRAAGLNHAIRSRADIAAAQDMMRVAADLGRVAGLLKLWLAERRGVGAPAIDVDQMMAEFRELQREVREKAGAIVYDR